VLGDGGAGGGFVGDGFPGGAGGEQCGCRQAVDRAGQAAGVGVDDADGVVGEEGVGPAGERQVGAEVAVGLGGGDGRGGDDAAEHVRFVDREDDVPVPLVGLGGECCLDLGDQGGVVEAGCLAERGGQRP